MAIIVKMLIYAFEMVTCGHVHLVCTFLCFYMNQILEFCIIASVQKVDITVIVMRLFDVAYTYSLANVTFSLFSDSVSIP